jgi:hypothetical protein
MLPSQSRLLHTSPHQYEKATTKNASSDSTGKNDPRIGDLGRAIEDDYATIRSNYGIPPPPSLLLSLKENC